ncbi:MAG: sigma-E processing peptidase SpoIIGA, partial [Lachnospiraceae bacterium]|nr:sigma-E processing peptidase SpoIIGA [Lachnospiraceae bacterium]
RTEQSWQSGAKGGVNPALGADTGRDEMAETAYLDLIFLVNLAMDYLLLCLTALFCKSGAGRGRRFAAAAFGALCACVPVFFPIRGAAALGFLPVCAAVIAWIAFGGEGRKVLQNSAAMLALTFVLGGMIYSAGMAVCGQWGMRESSLSLSAAGLTAATAAAAGCILLVRAHRREGRKRLIYPVRLVLFGQEVCCRGLLDTGNCLYEPFGGRPVILLTDRALMQAVREGLQREPQKSRFVPFRSVGNREGILEGTELSELVISLAQGEVKQNGVVAACAGFEAGRKEYQVILHPDLLPDFISE